MIDKNTLDQIQAGFTNLFRNYATVVAAMNPKSSSQADLDTLDTCHEALAELKQANLTPAQLSEILKPLVDVVVPRIMIFLQSKERSKFRMPVLLALRDVRIPAEKMMKPPPVIRLRPNFLRDRHRNESELFEQRTGTR